MIKQQDIFNFEVSNDTLNVTAQQEPTYVPDSVIEFLVQYNYFCSNAECSFTIDIPPDVAKFLLKYRNPRNRPLDKTRVDQYVTDAKNGNWKFTGDTIKFLHDGTIGDGQHRLKMVTILNVPVKFLVVTGLDEDALEAMDTGKPRTTKDVLSMFNNLGEKDAGMISTAMKKIVAYNRRGTLSGGSGNKKITTNPAMVAFFNANHDELLNSLYFVKKVGDKNNTLLQRGDFIFLHYIFSQIDKTIADDFMMKFITGADIPQKSNIYMLRQIIMKTKKSTSSKVPLHHLLFTAIKAWNNNRRGKVYATESNLKFYDGDTYPIAF